ncbi:hypothetical protein DPEC_G00319900 [Dallia pectoralis]|uniref:Uncharacterized protein n=1 Tax=Dallia pectoralis TaxID=75939 RepID=A0ACC2F9P5_DALPE|nr:hypothetical protein DPEC_G00319900 [Dallia pectoralis]
MSGHSSRWAYQMAPLSAPHLQQTPPTPGHRLPWQHEVSEPRQGHSVTAWGGGVVLGVFGVHTPVTVQSSMNTAVSSLWAGGGGAGCDLRGHDSVITSRRILSSVFGADGRAHRDMRSHASNTPLTHAYAAGESAEGRPQ